jgi:hypothetical protein
MSEYYGRYDKRQLVQLFVDNLMFGSISINSFAFNMDGSVDLRRSLEQSIIEYHKNPTEQVVDSIYEANIRLRVNGAVSYVLRDVSADEMIDGLREVIRQKDSEINALRSDNLKLAAELHRITTTEPPMKSGFDALK